MLSLQARFLSLVQRHVHKLTIRGSRGIGLCLFHPEERPSLSIDLEKAVFYCFGCGVGGGVKKFAELVGEPWAIASLTRREKARIATAIRRRDAERKEQVILQQREEKRLDEIFQEWRAANTEAAYAAELLSLLHGRPDLEAEFADLTAQAARDYSAAVSRRVLLEARINGEVE